MLFQLEQFSEFSRTHSDPTTQWTFYALLKMNYKGSLNFTWQVNTITRPLRPLLCRTTNEPLHSQHGPWSYNLTAHFFKLFVFRVQIEQTLKPVPLMISFLHFSGNGELLNAPSINWFLFRGWSFDENVLRMMNHLLPTLPFLREIDTVYFCTP